MKKTLKCTLFLALVVLTMVCMLVIGASALTDEDTAAAAAGTPVKVVYGEPADLDYDGTPETTHKYFATLTEAIAEGILDGDVIEICGSYTEDAAVTLLFGELDESFAVVNAANTAENPIVINGNGFTITNLALTIGDGALETHVQINDLSIPDTYTDSNGTSYPLVSMASLGNVTITGGTYSASAGPVINIAAENAVVNIGAGTTLKQLSTAATIPANITLITCAGAGSTLNVQGTSAAPVVMTSAATAAEQYGIYVTADTTITLNYLNITCGRALNIAKACTNTCTISNSTFNPVSGATYAYQYMIFVGGTVKLDISDSAFYNNFTTNHNSATMRITTALTGNYAMKLTNVTINNNKSAYGIRIGAAVEIAANSSVTGSSLNIFYVQNTLTLNEGCTVTNLTASNGAAAGAVTLQGTSAKLVTKGTANNPVVLQTQEANAYKAALCVMKSAKVTLDIDYTKFIASYPINVFGTINDGSDISNSEIYCNASGGSWSQITLDNGSAGTILFSNCKIYANAKYALAFMNSSAASAKFVDCEIIGKDGVSLTAFFRWQGTSATGGLTLEGTTVTGNTASYALGGSLASTMTITLKNSSISTSGSAIGTIPCKLVIENSTLETTCAGKAGLTYSGTNLSITGGSQILCSNVTTGVVALNVTGAASVSIQGTKDSPVVISAIPPESGNIYTSAIRVNAALTSLDIDYAELTGTYGIELLKAPATTVTINNSVLTGASNTAKNNAGLFIQAAATFIVEDSVITTYMDYLGANGDGSGNSFGIEINAAGATLTLNNCDISGFNGAFGYNAACATTATFNNCTLSSKNSTVIRVYGGTMMTLNNCTATDISHGSIFNVSDASVLTILGGTYISTCTESDTTMALVQNSATMNIYGGYFESRDRYMFRVQGHPDIEDDATTEDVDETSAVAFGTLNIYAGYFYRPACDTSFAENAFIRVGAGDETNNYMLGVANIYGGTYVADYIDMGAIFSILDTNYEDAYGNKGTLNLYSYTTRGAAYVATNLNDATNTPYENIRKEACYNSIKTFTGASLRIVYVEGDTVDVSKSGLRFTSLVSAGWLSMVANQAQGSVVEYGTLIVPARFVADSDYFTIESLTAANANPLTIKAENGILDIDGDKYIRASIYNLPHAEYNPGNGTSMTYASDYAAIVYATWTTADGTTVTQYADFDYEDNIANVADLAKAAYNDTIETKDEVNYPDHTNEVVNEAGDGFVYSIYTEDERKILAVYAAESTTETAMDVFILAGQSNASGYSTISDTFSTAFYEANPNGYSNVLYTGMAAFGGHTGAAGTYHNLVSVTPGLGYYSGAIGAELGIADILDSIYNADSKRTALIIKYADGGTYLSDCESSFNIKHDGNWMSPTSIATLGKNDEYYTGRQYKNLMAIIDSAMAQVKNEGYSDICFKGMFWMQGESDRALTNLTVYKGTAKETTIDFTNTRGTADYEMLDPTKAYSYPTLFKNLVNDIRKDVAKYADNDTSAMPVVVGTISEAFGRAHTDYNKYFIEMQKNVLPTVASGITTLDISMLPVGRDDNDNAHWGAEDMFLIGQMVGATFMGLDNPAITTDVSKAVAHVGGVYYTNLSYALAMAEEGESVTLLKDLTLTAALSIANTNTITLNGNGHTLTSDAPTAIRLIGTNITIKNLTLDLAENTASIKTYENAVYTMTDDGTSTVTTPVAAVYDADGTLIGSYFSHTEAIAAATTGGTVKFLSNITSATGIDIPADLSITIEGNGKTFTHTKAGSVALYVRAAANVTVKNLNITVTDATTTSYIAYGYAGATMEFIGGSFTAPNYGFMVRQADLTLILDGVTVNLTGTGASPSEGNPRTAIGLNSNAKNATITIKNGSAFYGTDAPNTYFINLKGTDPVLAIELETTIIEDMTFSEINEEVVVLNGQLAGASTIAEKISIVKTGSVYATATHKSTTCINVSTSTANRSILKVSPTDTYITINGEETTMSETPNIQQYKADAYTNEDGTYTYNSTYYLQRAEGGTMDDTGTYYYTVFMKNDYLPKALGKVNASTGAVQYISTPTMQLDHANDVAFIPGTNGENDRIVVVVNGSNANTVRIYEDTGSEFVEVGYETLPQNIWCLEYNPTTQQYVAGISGDNYQYMILDSEFALVSTLQAVRCDFTKQSVYCDDNYVYFLTDDADFLAVYDWEGNYAGYVDLADVLGNQETEGVAIVGNTAYVLVLDQDESTGYKVMNIVAYTLTVQ